MCGECGEYSELDSSSDTIVLGLGLGGKCVPNVPKLPWWCDREVAAEGGAKSGRGDLLGSKFCVWIDKEPRDGAKTS